ncbi:MAG TPA: DUF1398 family protein [Thermoanaerobaculia bacterium]|nr:DUF1398 family protein [Thermoanaerobaculia bacterium]
MNTTILLETTRLAFTGEIPFPLIIERLASAGVERYIVDLSARTRTCYDEAGNLLTDPMPLHDASPIDATWYAEQIREAIRASQQKEISYPEFLRRIMTAGCAAYAVFLAGRQVIYWSRRGEFHVEPFPSRT